MWSWSTLKEQAQKISDFQVCNYIIKVDAITLSAQPAELHPEVCRTLTLWSHVTLKYKHMCITIVVSSIGSDSLH